MSITKRRWVMKKLLLLTAAAVLLAAPAARAEKAYSVPVSDKIVKLELQAPDGHWIKGMVLEGDQFRIDDSVLKLSMAFIPVTTERGVRVRVFRIEKHGKDESMHFVENIETNLGDTAYTKKASVGFGIRVLDVVKPPANSKEPAVQ
jgi:hypothetical protein